MKRSLLLVALLSTIAAASGMAAIKFIPHEPGGEHRTWAFEIGVAYITSNSIDDYLDGRASVDQGAAGGEIYVITASRRLGELEWQVGNCVFRPQLELPFTLEIVDENSRRAFLDYNVSFNVRWIDFPWNDFVSTTFSMGVGLSYSEKVYLMDIQRHPNDNRSNLKFNWPIALTLASPRVPDYQGTLFILHQSGGHIFDKGGVNSLGFGLRRGF
jgi:hypothetical protein